MEYKDGDFCKTECSLYDRFIVGDLTVCRNCKAYQFHDWLINRGYKIERQESEDAIEMPEIIHETKGNKELYPGADALREIAVNFQFLFTQIEKIHQCLCPGHIGTWQERASQTVKVAQNLGQG